MALAVESALPDRAAVQDLYDRGRFLDAYRMTAALWSSRSAAEALDAPGLVLGYRLARHLGGDTLARALARRANAIAPEAPEVRYFCPTRGRRELRLLEALERFEEHPELDSGDMHLDASWCASHGALSAAFRDFDRSRERLDRARVLVPRDPFTDACEASARLASHDWPGALRFAERAFAERPWGGRAGSALAEALQAQGRFQEASDRLIAGALEHRQGFLPLLVGLWAGVRACRRDLMPDPRAWAEASAPLTSRLDELAPLADRGLRRGGSALRAQLALLEEDLPAAIAHARAVVSPYYTRLAEHLEASAHRPRIILEHAMLRQKHDTCLPASAAVALSALGREVDHDAVVRAITSSGTPLHRLADWARAEGLEVRFFRGTMAAAAALLERGLPFVLTSARTDSAHAWAAVGIDPDRQVVLLHDPSSNELDELDLDALAAPQAPLGPRCAVIAPPEQLARAAGLELPDEAASAALVEIDRRSEEGTGAALAATEERREALGEDAWAIERALRLGPAGRPTEARARLLEAFEERPTSVFVRRGLLDATLAAATFDEARATLRAIADARGLPAGESTRAWEGPEPAVLIRLARLLMQAAEHFEEARRLLERTLAGAPFDADALHALSLLRARMGDERGARLPARLAAALEPERLDYAADYADRLTRTGDPEAGEAFLRARAEERDREVGADGPWRVLVEHLELFGQPDAASAALERARQRWPRDGRLAAFAAQRYLLAGQRDRAEAALEIARGSAPRTVWRPVEVLEAQLDGELEQARLGLEEIVEGEPRALEPRRELLAAVIGLRGPEAADALLEGWWRATPDNDAVEILQIEHLVAESREEEALAILEARSGRQPTDTWALIERARLILDRELRRGGRLEEVRALAERAVAIHPGLASGEALLGRLDERAGALASARARFAAAIADSPGYMYALERLLVITARLGEAAWPDTLDALDRAYGGATRVPGRAAEAVKLLVRHRDRETAEAALARWSAGRPRDPEVAVAQGELELADAPGASAAERVLEQTEAIAIRFPRHLGLGALRARAFELTGQLEAAAEAFAALARSHPADPELRAQHLDALERSGEIEAALAERQRWVASAPRWVPAHLGLAAALERQGRLDEAADVLAAATARAPAEPAPWRARAELLDRLDRRDALLALAEELAERQPGEAWAAAQRGRIQASETVRAPVDEVVACFRRATELDREAWGWVCELSDYLAAQGELDRARAVIEEFLPRAIEPFYALGALAELSWAMGQQEAAWEELSRAFELEPSYAYGWRLALDWLEQEDDPEAAQRMLERMGPEARRDPDLASRRLATLRSAGAPAERLEAEWAALLAERPAELAVLARAFDFHLAADRVADATRDAEALLRYHPSAPATLSRQARLHMALGEPEAAIRATLELVRSPFEIPVQSAVDAASALDRPGLRVRVSRALRAELDSGAAPLAVNLMAWTMAVDALEDAGALELLAFGFFEATPLGHPEHAFALAISKLTSLGHGAALVRRWSAAAPERFERDDQLRMVEVQAAAEAGDPERARQRLADWRERPGVEQWGLAAYAWACQSLGDEAEALEALEHGLFALPVSGDIVGIATRGCELALMREETARFMAFHRRLRFSAPPGGDMTRRALDLFARLLEGEPAMDLDREFRALGIPQESYLGPRWRRLIYPQVPWWKKALIVLGI